MPFYPMAPAPPVAEIEIALNMKPRLFLAILASVTIVFWGGCKKDKFVEVVGTCPLVVFTSPANGETGVPLSKIITATFNESMRPSTITGASFTIAGGAMVSGIVTYAGETASFSPVNPLLPNTTYTGKITTAAKDLKGNALQTEYVWSFSTGATVVPMVISTDPINLATGVVLNKVVQASFNMPMDPLTINATTVTLRLGSTAIPGTVTYLDSTASFTANSALITDTTYTATVTTGAKNLAGVAIAADYVWSFRTGTTIAPTVISTIPINNATGVPQNQVLSATFSEPMAPGSLNASTFLLRQGANVITGTVTYSGSTASFTPTTNLMPGTVYTATITTGAQNPASVGLANNYVWTFTTLVIPAPTVVSTDPANNAVGVLRNKVITATFSEAMNPATIGSLSFTVRNGLTPVSGTVTYSGLTASFVPTTLLNPNTVYTATISTMASSMATGVPLAINYVWTFTTIVIPPPTVISTVPINNATGVPLNQVVTATFSEAMNPATIGSLTFTLKQGLTIVPGTVTYAGNTATYTPSSNLNSGLVYTATITTGARSLANNIPLAANYVWTFTAIVIPPPTVISTVPVNNATGVPLNQVVTATFSEAMSPASINALTFTLKQGVTTVPGNVTYSGNTATYTPSSNLNPSLVYTATITTGARSLANNIPLASNYVWTFTTIVIPPPVVVSTDPFTNETNVPLAQVISATFSVPMDPLSITTSTFTLRKGVVVVPGVVNYSGNTATFTPNAFLESNATYTATVTNGVRSAVNINMVSNYVWNFSTVQPLGPPPVDLGTANRFGILAGVGISNNAGFSEIHDLDVGISPGVRSSVTGFPPAIVVNGAIYCSDDLAPPGTAAMLIQAKSDLTAAYLFAEAATSPAPATVSGDLGGLTLAPGIYKSTSTLMVQSGDLTLDAQGDVNATWIFQIASGFTTVGGAGGNIILIGGAQANNVTWQTGSSATIGDFTAFKGNILALTSITMNSDAVSYGRMLARNGAVVMTSTNFIYRP